MSDDYVLDASALVLALVGKTETADSLRHRLPTMRRHAPHLIDADIGNVLRRHEQSGRISDGEARTALAASRVLVEHRYPHVGPLAELAWTWRASIGFYDALYVALAVQLDVPLITADAKLSRARHLGCRTELI